MRTAQAAPVPGRRRLAAFGFLLLAVACGPKKYALLSPEENYSDDPSLSIQVAKVLEVSKGRTEVRLTVENRRAGPLDLGEAQVALLDADERNLPALGKPKDVLAPAESKEVTFAFDTTDAAKGAFEMRLMLPGAKVWPIIFSTEKPPEFKPTPPPVGPQGPGPGPGF